MLREIFLIGSISTTMLCAMGGPVPNYDEKFNENINERIKENMATSIPIEEEVAPIIQREKRSSNLSNIKLKSLVFKEINHKNIPVTEVESGSKVVYINVAINDSSEIKRDVIVRNPIPMGAEYVRGSATCNGNCMIFYSSDVGGELSAKEGRVVSYIEYHFKRMNIGQEYKMGFRATIK